MPQLVTMPDCAATGSGKGACALLPTSSHALRRHHHRGSLQCIASSTNSIRTSVNGVAGGLSAPISLPTAAEVAMPASPPSAPPAAVTVPASPPQQDITGAEVEQRALRLAVSTHERWLATPNHQHREAGLGRWTGQQMDDAYERCGFLTSEYAKTFFLGTQLMTPEKAKAIWAIYVWCRRTDELVDGPNAARVTPAVLDRWERRLEETFAGQPYDVLDAALAHTVQAFPVDIQSFRDMIGGMRMDLYKPRYQTFDELYEYCYRVAGTVGLMTTPVMGIDPRYKGDLTVVYKAALALGTANQLTNILRDVGEDAFERNRIYVPLQELEQYGLTEQGILNNAYVDAEGNVDPRWQDFMRFQIKRAREYFAEAEQGVFELDANARWPVWSALVLYRMILDRIEANNYNNFTKRAYVPKWQKLALLPVTMVQAMAK